MSLFARLRLLRSPSLSARRPGEECNPPQDSAPNRLTSAAARVDDAPGWSAISRPTHDHDSAQIQTLYANALEAWRKNPIAWRIIAITTDYVVGSHLAVSSKNRALNKFILSFWHHPKNRLDLRLEAMCDELSRSGDLFVLLFRNPADGMSYIRFVTKDLIQRIETLPDDYETELVFYETQPIGQPKAWLSPHHPDAPYQDAIMLHYAVNRPLGALLGESDLTTMIPWLLRYSRMLEDRVRLHWAMRAFLWIVTVPAQKVREKQEFYRTPPEAGSIVVKDPLETWEAVTPSLNAADASHDLKAVRNMIDAGSGYPPHWRGDPAETNLATAQAMQGPPEHHLRRRQQYFNFIIQDILFHAYQRAVEVGAAKRLPSSNYEELFTIELPDISRFDNEILARSVKDLSAGLATLGEQLRSVPPTLARQILNLCFQFAGAPLSETQIEQILSEYAPRQSPLP